MTTAYRFGPYVLDVARRELRNKSDLVELPGTVFEALCYLVETRDRAVGRDELARAIFRRSNVSDVQIAQIVLRARRAVCDDGHDPKIIRTIPRFGYRWIADTQVDPAPIESPRLETRELSPAPVPARMPPLRLYQFLVVVCLTLVLYRAGPTPTSGQQLPVRVVVLPTVIDEADDADWARYGLMDAMIGRMRRAGLPVISSDDTLSLLGSAYDKHDVGQVHQRIQAGLVVRSRAVRGDEHWRLELVASGTGPDRRSEAIGKDLLQVSRDATERLLAALGRPGPHGPELALALDERLQRAQAAILSNELEAARQILSAAPDSQRSDPEVRLKQAQLEYRAGDLEQAELALNKLLQSEQAKTDLLLQGRGLAWRAATRLRLGAAEDAERDFTSAITALGSGRYPLELGRALMGRGSSRSLLGRVDEALVDLAEARVHLLRGGDPLAIARLDGNIGALHSQSGRPDQAIHYFDAAIERFAAFGAVSELMLTYSHRGYCHLALLQTDAAWRDSESNWALRARAVDPTHRQAIMLDRIDVLSALGRFSEADAVLADPELATLTSLNEQRRLLYTRAELELRRGRPTEALRIADRTLANWPRSSQDPRRDWLVLRRQQAALALGVPPLEVQSDSTDTRAGIAPFLNEAIARRWRGDIDGADALYREAIAVADRDGIPAEILEGVEAYAPWLIERGLIVEASGLIGRVAPWSERDFMSAMLHVSLFQAMKLQDPLQTALADARRLAGERPVPFNAVAAASNR